MIRKFASEWQFVVVCSGASSRHTLLFRLIVGWTRFQNKNIFPKCRSVIVCWEVRKWVSYPTWRAPTALRQSDRWNLLIPNWRIISGVYTLYTISTCSNSCTTCLGIIKVVTTKYQFTAGAHSEGTRSGVFEDNTYVYTEYGEYIIVGLGNTWK